MKTMIRIRIRINYEENDRDRDKDGIMKRMIRIGMRIRLWRE